MSFQNFRVAWRSSIFFARPTNRMSVVQSLFRWVRVQSHSQDTIGGSKTALGLVGIYRHQAINLAPLRKVRAWRTPPEAWGCRSSCTSINCYWNQYTSDQIRAPIKRGRPKYIPALPSQRVVHALHNARGDSCLCLPSDRTWHKVNDSKGDYSGEWGTSLGTSPVWFCKSSVHLGPDEPNMVQARMLNYRLKWTARGSAIHSWQRCQCCCSLTWRWPSWSWGHFGLKSTKAMLGER